jgi:hypothetical protein
MEIPELWEQRAIEIREKERERAGEMQAKIKIK